VELHLFLTSVLSRGELSHLYTDSFAAGGKSHGFPWKRGLCGPQLWLAEDVCKISGSHGGEYEDLSSGMLRRVV
jgi:hypothetical protein